MVFPLDIRVFRTKPKFSTMRFSDSRFRHWFLSLLLANLMLLPSGSYAQPYQINDLIPDAPIERRFEATTYQLKQFTDEIVVLGFFTQWCGSCRRALEALVPTLAQRNNRNRHDIPIRLIGVNLDPEEPSLTDVFIQDIGLEFVADDFDRVLWDAFTEATTIPLFAVINGVPRSPSHRQWELVHRQLGLSEPAAFMAVLDTIEPSQTLPPRTNPFADLPADGYGWRESDWFGRFNDRRFPWIFHETHEWLYLARQSEPNNIYAYDQALGWINMSRADHPQLFSFSRNSWLATDPTPNPERQLFDQTAAEWLTFPTERQAQPGGRNGFLFSNALIPRHEIRSGGPPRDGIPAILEPKFVSPTEADTFMRDKDVVISVTHAGETRAYPFRILNWHEVVNDTIGDLHFAASYCPLCGTAISFNRTVNGRILTFGVSGLLYLDNVLMYDHQSESLWSQLFLQGVTGPQFGTPLDFVPSTQLLYGSWKALFPEGRVLSTDTGHTRNYDINPYARYFENPNPLFPVGDIRNDLEAKAWVYGVLVGDRAIAFSRDNLPSGQAFELDFNGQTLAINYDENAQRIDVTESQSGVPLTGLWSFWFAWQAFHPETELWTGNPQ